MILGEKKFTPKSEQVSAKLKLKQNAVISKIYTKVHNFNKIHCKYSNKTIKLLLPFISWDFYTIRMQKYDTQKII